MSIGAEVIVINDDSSENQEENSVIEIDDSSSESDQLENKLICINSSGDETEPNKKMQRKLSGRQQVAGENLKSEARQATKDATDTTAPDDFESSHDAYNGFGVKSDSSSSSLAQSISTKGSIPRTNDHLKDGNAKKHFQEENKKLPARQHSALKSKKAPNQTKQRANLSDIESLNNSHSSDGDDQSESSDGDWLPNLETPKRDTLSSSKATDARKRGGSDKTSQSSARARQQNVQSGPSRNDSASELSGSVTSTSYLSSIGEDQNHPKNGRLVVRVRSSDGKMILTRRKPKARSPGDQSSKHEKLEETSSINAQESRRCPICFTHIPVQSFNKHKSTCGQDLIGEFQNSLDIYKVDQPEAETKSLLSHFSYPPEATHSTHKKRKLEDQGNDVAHASEKKPAPKVPKIEETKSGTKAKPAPTEEFKVYRKPPARISARRAATAIALNSNAKGSKPEEPHLHSTRGGSKRKSTPKRNGKDGEGWRDEVEDAIREARKKRKTTRQEMLKNALNAKNDMLCKPDLLPPKEIQFPVLNGGSVGLDSTQDTDHPLPRDDFTTIFLKKHIHSDEKTDPSDSDSKSNSKPNEAYEDDATLSTAMSKDKIRFSAKIEEFNDGEKIGVGYEENDTDEDITEVLGRLQDVGHDRDEVHTYLALLLQEKVQRVRDRYTKIDADSKPKPKRDDGDPYTIAMSSFRDMFCRRCLTYDCNLHGLPEDTCAVTQAELAIQKESMGFWKDRMPVICQSVAAQNDSKSLSSEEEKDQSLPEVPEKKLSQTEKALCEKLYHVFGGDIDKVALAVGVSRDAIINQTTLVPFQFTKIDPKTMSENRSRANKSNTYNPTWVKKIVETKSHPFFYPCYHAGLCSEKNCTCIQNGFFCTKHCVWGSTSRNFFKGCNCTAKCTAKSCPCFASNRECDPDLCRRCDACSDPPNQPAINQPCRNDNIGMRRHVHLLVGKSNVAGWGLFTKYPLKKGDYIHEYLGEVIPQEEAEKRGAVYDERNQTYLFELSSNCAVDALRKGNKTRFINHSTNPNIFPRILVVNGDFRIGFFAKIDIPAQTELFFDYGKMFFSSKGSFAKRSSSTSSKEKEKDK